MNRRKFLEVTAAAGTGLAMAPSVALGGVKNITPIVLGDNDKPALLGGPMAHPGKFPPWPVYDSTEEQALLDILNGSNSNLPSQDQIGRKGYEVEKLMWSAPRRVADNADMHLINDNLTLIEKFT